MYVGDNDTGSSSTCTFLIPIDRAIERYIHPMQGLSLTFLNTFFL